MGTVFQHRLFDMMYRIFQERLSKLQIQVYTERYESLVYKSTNRYRIVHNEKEPGFPYSTFPN